MSDSRYSYDEKAEVWPYFAVTLVGVVLVPSTYFSVKRYLKPDDDGVKLSAKYRPENHDQIAKFRAKEKRSRILTKTNVAIAIGWAVMAFLIYIIMNQTISEDNKDMFDPYDILGVSFSATEKQIKSTYRKLSLQFHPDKLREYGNNTKEEMEARYVEITKAYKALTDEVTRENFLKYGHPDGPQQTSHGIALPKFLVEGKGSPIVIGAYASMIGILLPWIVGSWWAGVRTYTKNGIHQKSAAIFFEACAKEQPHFINYEKILNMLSRAEEFNSLIPNASPQYVRELIDAHLNRKPVKNEVDKLVVVSRCSKLLDGLLDIASAFKDAGLCQRIIEIERCIVQAVPITDQAYGELLQLPGVGLSDVGPEIKTKLNEDAEYIARKTVPKLHLLKAFFRVPGEEGNIPPQAQAHLVIKYVVYPHGKKLPHISEELLEDNDENDHSIMSEPLSTNDLPPPIPNVHAPYFPTSFKPSWYGFIVSERDNKIIDGPQEMDKVCLDNLKLSDKDLADPSKLKIGSFKIQLTSVTPPVPNTYQFKLNLLNSGYFGCDIVDTVSMKVVNAPPPQPSKIEEIVDDEEDELDEKKIKSTNGAASATENDGDDGDSSDEEEEDLSDIDTDTDASDDEE